MKKIFLFCLAVCMLSTGFAQEPKNDTIRVGGMIIIKKPGKDQDRLGSIEIPRRRYYRAENVSTNWWIVDLGFANYTDKTDYAMARTTGFVDAGIGEDQLKLRAGKSRNVNIWVFMQRLNMIEHVVNLKYGLGLELNNYFYDYETIRFQKNPTFITMDPPKSIKKNKLAADYLTVPVMLNINFTPDRRNGFGVSGGISAGYLYSARQKIKEGGKVSKLKNDFDLERWKLSYVGEILLGPVKLYGSYALDNMWDKGLDQTPYTIGFRLSNW